jgi:hypothetical protein
MMAILIGRKEFSKLYKKWTVAMLGTLTLSCEQYTDSGLTKRSVGRPLLVLHPEKLETIGEEHSELETGGDKSSYQMCCLRISCTVSDLLDSTTKLMEIFSLMRQPCATDATT